MNRKAFEKMNYGLYIVSAAADGKRYGCIVNSLAQVTSSQPAKFTITLNKDNATCDAVQKAGSFSATMLAKDCPKDWIHLFGYKSTRVVDKFDGLASQMDAAGNPYLTEHMAARISCNVVDSLAIGNYILFVGEATEAEVLSDSLVLTVDEFKNKGNTPPPAATVYRTLDGTEGYKCTVCGYVYDKDTLPEGYQCPICRAPASKFEKR